MQGRGQQHLRSRAVLFLLVSVMFFTPLSPMASLFASEAEAAIGTRHVYEFSDGSVEHIALYQDADRTLTRGGLGLSPSWSVGDRREHDPLRCVGPREHAGGATGGRNW